MEGNIYLAPEKQTRVTAKDIRELRRMSLGYTPEESAAEEGISSQGIDTRRRKIKAIWGGRTFAETIANGIHTGYIFPKIEEKPLETPLSPMQDNILRLKARGWTMTQIAQRYSMRDNTISSHYHEICRKLDARNINHSITRAFERKLFVPGEEILDPADHAASLEGGLQVHIDGQAFNMSELGVTNIHDLEILSLLPGIRNGQFDRATIYELGFYDSAPSDNAKSQAYGRAILRIANKLEAASGSPVLAKDGIKGYRKYRLLKALGIGTQEGVTIVDPYNPAFDTDKQKPFKKATRSASGKKSDHSAAKRTILPPSPDVEFKTASDYLDQTNLVPLEELAPSLRPRDTTELMDGTQVFSALRSVQDRGGLGEYRHRIIVPLRYGILPNLHRQPLVLRRLDRVYKFDEITSLIPPFQGLDIKSTSLLTGLRPNAVIRAELEILNQYAKEHPVLKPVRDMMARKLREVSDTL